MNYIFKILLHFSNECTLLTFQCLEFINIFDKCNIYSKAIEVQIIFPSSRSLLDNIHISIDCHANIMPAQCQYPLWLPVLWILGTITCSLGAYIENIITFQQSLHEIKIQSVTLILGFDLHRISTSKFCLFN